MERVDAVRATRDRALGIISRSGREEGEEELEPTFPLSACHQRLAVLAARHRAERCSAWHDDPQRQLTGRQEGTGALLFSLSRAVLASQLYILGPQRVHLVRPRAAHQNGQSSVRVRQRARSTIAPCTSARLPTWSGTPTRRTPAALQRMLRILRIGAHRQQSAKRFSRLRTLDEVVALFQCTRFGLLQ